MSVDIDFLVNNSIKECFQNGVITGAASKILKSILERLTRENVDIDYTVVRKVVKALDVHGFFELRSAVNKVSDTFNVSRVTVYSAIKSDS